MQGQERFYSASQFSETNKGEVPEFGKIFERLHSARGIVFFDLDKTAINEEYKPTNPDGIKNAITELQKKGILVGIHSDSPRETVMQFAEMFGTEGPLIYEMSGIHFTDILDGRDIGIDIALDIESLDFFNTLKDSFIEKLMESFPDAQIDGSTDFNKALRDNQELPEGRSVWINPFRRFSLGFWAKDIINGKPVNNPLFHEAADRLLKDTVKEMPDVTDKKDLAWDYNPDYGVTIIRFTARTSKTPPIETILDALAGGFSKPVFMIGDSEADYISDPKVTTLAVGNAKDTLKNMVLPENISQSTYTDGVIEHMNKIIDYFTS